MQAGCHSLIFGTLPADDALIEIARAGFDQAVLAEIKGQAQHASALERVPLLPVVALDIAAGERARIRGALDQAARLGISTVLLAPGGRPGRVLRVQGEAHETRLGGPGERSVPRRLAVTPRAGSAVWNAETALRLVQRQPDITLWPDTSHLARARDDLPAAARALTPYSAGWFIRDYAGTGTGPGAFESQVPGGGILDLDGTLKALQDAGFNGPIVFHSVGHLPGGRPHPEYPIARIKALAREARDYLSRYCTSSAERPT